MTDFHDFSTRRPSAPRPPQGSGRNKRTLVVVVVAALVLAGGALAFSQFREDGSGVLSGPVNPRYCAISTRLGGLLAAVGVPPAGPVPETVRPEAVKAVLAEMGAEIEELRKVAPSTVRDDVDAYLTAIEDAAAGDMRQARSARFVENGRAIVGFLQTDPCRTGTTPADPGDSAS